MAASISERDIRIRRFGQNVRGKRDPPHFDRSRNPPRKNNFVATIARPWQGNRGQYAAIIFESGQTFREFRAWTMGLDPLKVQLTKAALVLASYPKSRFAASEAETWRLSRLAAPHACARESRLGRGCRAGKTMNWEKPHLLVRYRLERGFETLVDRTIREQRCEERRLAERRTSKHRLQAKKSCIPDARSYRVARRLLLLVRAQF